MDVTFECRVIFVTHLHFFSVMLSFNIEHEKDGENQFLFSHLLSCLHFLARVRPPRSFHSFVVYDGDHMTSNLKQSHIMSLLSM